MYGVADRVGSGGRGQCARVALTGGMLESVGVAVVVGGELGRVQ